MAPILEVRNATKRFPGVLANDRVSFSLNEGEILAFLGENGAGKSTLMNILYGLYEPDEGEIVVRGREVQIEDPNDAIRLGIGMVHQHFQLVPVFTVAENIVMGTEPTRPSFSWRTVGMAGVAGALLFLLGGFIALDNPVQWLLAALSFVFDTGCAAVQANSQPTSERSAAQEYRDGFINKAGATEGARAQAQRMVGSFFEKALATEEKRAVLESCVQHFENEQGTTKEDEYLILAVCSCIVCCGPDDEPYEDPSDAVAEFCIHNAMLANGGGFAKDRQ